MYSYANEFKNGLSLVEKGDKYFLIDKSGKENPFSKEVKNIDRFNNIFMGIKEHPNNQKKICVFRETKYIGNIFVQISDHHLTYNVIANKYIDIGDYFYKYNSVTRIESYIIEGDKIIKDESKTIEQFIKEIPTESKSLLLNYISSKDTPWQIIERQLFFKSLLIYEYNDDWFDHLYIDGFFYGIGKLFVVVDIDPEWGINEWPVGYLDIHGNIYFED